MVKKNSISKLPNKLKLANKKNGKKLNPSKKQLELIDDISEVIAEEITRTEEEDSNENSDLAESPIKANGIPKIKSVFSPNTPTSLIIVVKNFPGKFKQIDFVEGFAKYGTINFIKPVYKSTVKGKTCDSVMIVFATAKEAQAALAANGSAKVKNTVVKVSLKRPTKTETQQKSYEEKKQQFNNTADRTICVKNFKSDTTKKILQAHFDKCGEIERVTVKAEKHYAFIEFKETKAIASARKLHNTVLNGATINVFPRVAEQSKNVKDRKRTILLKNDAHLDSISSDKLTPIFAKYGEIEELEIICKKHVLAFITYKTEEATKNALLELNGKRVGGLDLLLETYNLCKGTPKTTIFVQNIQPGVTKEEVENLFEQAGAVKSVLVKTGFAIVQFADSDGYCKSFLLNEVRLRGQVIYIEPYCEKPRSAQSRPSHFAGKKRPHQLESKDKHRKKLKST